MRYYGDPTWTTIGDLDRATAIAAEIRRNPDGTPDDIVARHPVGVHIEQMDTNHWWIGIDLSDSERITIDLTSNSRIGVYTNIESDTTTPGIGVYTNIKSDRT